MKKANFTSHKQYLAFSTLKLQRRLIQNKVYWDVFTL